MSGRPSFLSLARETMDEQAVHDLLVGAEEEVASDPEAALDRAYFDVANHYAHVVILAWNDEHLAVVGEEVEEAVALLEKARRYDERLSPLRAHLNGSDR